jgi:hypothetical protein
MSHSSKGSRGVSASSKLLTRLRPYSAAFEPLDSPCEILRDIPQSPQRIRRRRILHEFRMGEANSGLLLKVLQLPVG